MNMIVPNMKHSRQYKRQDRIAQKVSVFLFSLFLFPSLFLYLYAQTGPVAVQDGGTIAVSGGSLTFPGQKVIANTFEEIVTGAPATLTVTISGQMRGGTPTVIDTYTTVANANRSVSGIYDLYTVTATWTGGTAPTVTVNRTGINARLTTPGSGGVSVTTPASVDVSSRPGASFDAQLADCQTQLVSLGKAICDATGYTSAQQCLATTTWTTAGKVILWPLVNVSMGVGMTGSANPCVKDTTNSLAIIGTKGLSKLTATATGQYLILVTGGGAFTAQPLAADALDGSFPPAITLSAGNYTSVAGTVGGYLKLSDTLFDARSQICRILTAVSPTYTCENPIYDNFRQGTGGQVARLSMLNGVVVRGMTFDGGGFANVVCLKVDYVAYSELYDNRADNCNQGGIATSNNYHLNWHDNIITNSGQANMFITVVNCSECIVGTTWMETRGTASFELQFHQVHGSQIHDIVQVGANFSGRLCKFYHASHDGITNLNCNRGGASGATNNGLKLERNSHDLTFTNLLAKNNYGNGVLNSEGIENVKIVNSTITHNEADQISGIVDFARQGCMGDWTAEATANGVCVTIQATSPNIGTMTATMGTRSGSSNTVLMVTDGANGFGTFPLNFNDDPVGMYIRFKGWANAGNNATWFPITAISADGKTLTITDAAAATVAEASRAGVGVIAYRPDKNFILADNKIGYDRATSGRAVSISGDNWHVHDNHLLDDLNLSTMAIGFVSLSLGSGPQGIALAPTQGSDIHDNFMQGFPANKDIDFTSSNAANGFMRDNRMMEGVTWTNIGAGWTLEGNHGNATDIETVPRRGTKALVAGTATVTYTVPFAAVPIVQCTDQTAAAAVKCVSTTTVLTITGTGTDVIGYDAKGAPN